jgi:hypothetical protein
MQLQRAVLRPVDELVCINKESLLRTEEKDSARVLPFRRWSLAAASIVILAAGAFWLIRATRQERPSSGTATSLRPVGEPANKVVPGNATQNANPATPSVAPADQNSITAKINVSGNPLGTAIPSGTKTGQENPSVSPSPDNTPSTVPVPEGADLAIQRTQSSSNMSTGFSPMASAPMVAGTSHVAQGENNTPAVTLEAPASYHTLGDTEEGKDEDRILFVRADQVVGGDVKGFFRKASRVLKHTTSLNSESVHPDPSADPR